jgi:SlyX protein
MSALDTYHRLELHMDTDTQIQTRLTELEVKLSFTEDLVDELNRTVALQQEQILLLQDELRAVFQQMQLMAPAEKADLREDIPPHY